MYLGDDALQLLTLLFSHLNEICQLMSEICGETENCAVVRIQRKALPSGYFSCRQSCTVLETSNNMEICRIAVKFPMTGKSFPTKYLTS